MKQEAKGLGFTFPPLKERFERLEDALQIAHAMWSGKEDPFTGSHIIMERPLNSPQPISRPHPPIPYWRIRGEEDLETGSQICGRL